MVETEANPHQGWTLLNRVAAICAVAPLFTLVFDIVVSMVLGAAPTSQRNAGAWLALFQQSPILGLQGLSFPQVVTTALTIPLTVALYGALRRRGAGLALLSLSLFVIGAAIFLANSGALPMLALSQRYAAAGSDNERQVLLAAAEALLAKNPDFNPSGFLAFGLPCLSGLLMAGLMIVSPDFGRWRGWIGLIGYGLLLVFTVGACFVDGGFALLMPVSLVGGLAIMVWDITVAWRLWNLGRRVA